MTLEESQEWAKARTKEWGLTGKSTRFQPDLGIGNLTLVKMGWFSEDKEDVRKLLEKKIPVSWQTEKCGIVEVGFNRRANKYVGVHWFHQNILANPRFEKIEDCLSWYMSKVEEIKIEEQEE